MILWTKSQKKVSVYLRITKMPRNISEEKLQAKTYMILWWELEMFRFSFIKLKNRENDR